MGVFPVESSMASDAGLLELRGRKSIEAARKRLIEAGYSGEKVVVLSGAGSNLRPGSRGCRCLRPCRLQPRISGTRFGCPSAAAEQRGTGQQGRLVDNDGAPASFGFIDPAVHQFIRGNGEMGLFGWPKVPRLEELRNAWFDAEDHATRKAIAAEMQVLAIDEVTYIPLGSYRSYTA